MPRKLSWCSIRSGGLVRLKGRLDVFGCPLHNLVINVARHAAPHKVRTGPERFSCDHPTTLRDRARFDDPVGRGRIVGRRRRDRLRIGAVRLAGRFLVLGGRIGPDPELACDLDRLMRGGIQGFWFSTVTLLEVIVLGVVAGRPPSEWLERAAAILTHDATRELAYIVEIEHYVAKVGGADRESPVALRVTTVLRREEAAWRTVHRHADPITTPQAAETVISKSGYRRLPDTCGGQGARASIASAAA